jgi:hypothetical protein
MKDVRRTSVNTQNKVDVKKSRNALVDGAKKLFQILQGM